METERRNKWIGILIGACIIATGFYIGILSGFFYSLILFFLIGGFIAGIFTSRNVREGIWYGLLSGIVGACFIVVPILLILVFVMMDGPADFAIGMLLFLGLIIAFIAIILAPIGAGIGIVAKRVLFEDSNEK